MSDLKQRDYNRVIWIPLLSRHTLSKKGEYGHDGHLDEYIGSYAVMLEERLKETALSLDWTDVSVNWDNRSSFENGAYREAGVYQDYRHGEVGKYLTLIQSFESLETSEWHLDQDLVLALRLLREGDSWLAPDEDFIEVARLHRSESGSPSSLEIRAEHLKDYLRARDCGLLVARYHRRSATTAHSEHLPWEERDASSSTESYRWDGYIREIHEGGMPFGEKIAVFHSGRSNVNYEEDVPEYPTGPGENPNYQHWEVTQRGPRLFVVTSDLWKNDWVSPALKSPRVKGDEEPSVIPFVVNADGTTAAGNELAKGIRWVWFRPTVVEHLRNRRGGSLTWYTGDTGRLGATNSDAIHFGTNSLGLVNVLAYDLANLPEAHKKLWVAHNCSPEGQVSKELLMSQMEADPADSLPPELELWENMMSLQMAFERRFSNPLFRPSDSFETPGCHRFLSVDLEGLFHLSKELTRSTIEILNAPVLKDLTQNEDSKLRPLKRLEKLLTQAGADGFEVMGPLFAVYDLRQFDAHLPSADVSREFGLLGLDTNSDNYVEHGKHLLSRVSNAFAVIASWFDPRENA